MTDTPIRIFTARLCGDAIYEAPAHNFDNNARQEIQKIISQNFPDEYLNRFIQQVEIAVQRFLGNKIAYANTVPPELIKPITTIINKLDKPVEKSIQNIEQFESPENNGLYNTSNPAVQNISEIKKRFREISELIESSRHYLSQIHNKKPRKNDPYIFLATDLAKSMIEILNIKPTKYTDGILSKLFYFCLKSTGEYVGDENTKKNLTRSIDSGLSRYFKIEKTEL